MVADNVKDNKNRRKTIDSNLDNLDLSLVKKVKHSPLNKRKRRSNCAKKDDKENNVANEILDVIGECLGKKEKNKFEKECGFKTINSDVEELTHFNKNFQKELKEDSKQQTLLTSFFGNKRAKNTEECDHFDEK